MIYAELCTCANASSDVDNLLEGMSIEVSAIPRKQYVIINIAYYLYRTWAKCLFTNCFLK